MPTIEAEHLTGWKAIAHYLSAGVRTVQRYELELGLPIRRPAGQNRTTVIAIKSELDIWLKRSPIRVKSWPAEQTNKVGAEFLQIDSEIALTVSRFAKDSRDNVDRVRRTQMARRAYETILRLKRRIELTDIQRNKLSRNLTLLRSNLEGLGERFEETA